MNTLTLHSINTALTEFEETFGEYLPTWFLRYLKTVLPQGAAQQKVEVIAFETYDFETVDAYMHALHISSLGIGLNHLLSKHTGHILCHMCNCSDCFRAGTVTCDWIFEHKEIVGNDFRAHVSLQLHQFNRQLIA